MAGLSGTVVPCQHGSPTDSNDIPPQLPDSLKPVQADVTLTRIALLRWFRGLEENPDRRVALSHGGGLFDAAVADRLIELSEQASFAAEVGGLVQAGLVRTGSLAGGYTPLPDGARWNVQELYSRGDFVLTGDGLQATHGLRDDARPDLPAKPDDPDAAEAMAAPSVFISYAHEDKPLARAIARTLSGANCRVWIDEGELLGGDSLIEKIATGIGETDFVVALVSAASIESGWCQKEISLALTDGAREVRVKVIPIQVDSCTMPSALRDVLYLPIASSEPEAGLGRIVHSVLGQHTNQRGELVSGSARAQQLQIDLERIGEWERETLEAVDHEHSARGTFHSSFRERERARVQREAERRRTEARLRG